MMISGRGGWLRASLATVLFTTSLAAMGVAQAADVRIDSLKVGGGDDLVEFKGVDVTGTNLTSDEVTKLLAKDTSKDERTAIAAKMKASSASVSEMVVGSVEKGAISIKGIRADGVDEGKIARFTIAGADAGPKINGETGSFRAGSLTVDDIDVSTVFAGLKSGSLNGAKPKAGRMTWTGFEASFLDKDTPADAPGGNVAKIRFGGVDARSEINGSLQQGDATFKNLVIEFPKASEAGKQLAAMGYDRIDVSMSMRGAFDAAKKLLTISDFSVSGAGMGTFGMKADLGNYDIDKMQGGNEEKIAALMNVDVASLELSLVNNGIVEKGLAMGAQQQGKTPDALRKEASAMVTQLAPMMLGGDPSSLQVAGALASFIRDSKSLVVSVKGKQGPVKIASLIGMQPLEILQKVSLAAAANGAALPAAPAAAPAAPQPAQAAPQAGQAARKLTGLEAWNQIVGNSVNGKTPDGDEITEFYLKNGKVKQLIDDETTDGKWTVKGQQVCFLYDGDDDDDEECYKLEVVGDVATFIDSDNKGRRYKILKGNPKNL